MSFGEFLDATSPASDQPMTRESDLRQPHDTQYGRVLVAHSAGVGAGVYTVWSRSDSQVSMVLLISESQVHESLLSMQMMARWAGG